MLRQLMAASAGLSLLWTGSPLAAVPGGPVTFPMVVSAGAASCVPNAQGRVTISPRGAVENMHVEVSGLPPKSGFDFFVIQVPTSPFGMFWYQGDIDTDSKGNGV